MITPPKSHHHTTAMLTWPIKSMVNPSKHTSNFNSISACFLSTELLLASRQGYPHSRSICVLNRSASRCILQQQWVLNDNGLSETSGGNACDHHTPLGSARR